MSMATIYDPEPGPDRYSKRFDALVLNSAQNFHAKSRIPWMLYLKN